MPARLFTIIEGENLVNDATALTSYQLAVAAVVGGGFSLLDAGGRFLLAVVVAVGVGLLVAWVVRLIRAAIDDRGSCRRRSRGPACAAWSAWPPRWLCR